MTPAVKTKPEPGTLDAGRIYLDKDVARLFGVHERTISRWRRQGLIDAAPIEAGRIPRGGHTYGYTADAIERFADSVALKPTRQKSGRDNFRYKWYAQLPSLAKEMAQSSRGSRGYDSGVRYATDGRVTHHKD